MSADSEIENQENTTDDHNPEMSKQDSSAEQKTTDSTPEETIFFWSEPGVCGQRQTYANVNT